MRGGWLSTRIGSDAAVSTDEETGVIEVSIPSGTPFGLFDPGQLVSLQNKVFMLVTADVINTAAAHAIGSNISLLSPDGLGGAGTKSRVILDLGESNAQGIAPKVRRTLVPIDHKLTFDTTPDGAASGPTTIQLGLVALNDRTLFCPERSEDQFDAYMSVNTPIAPPAVFVTVPLNVQSFTPNPAVFSHTPPSGLVTVLVAGRYTVSADVSGFQSVTTSRSSVLWAVFRNGLLLPGTIMLTYHRTAAAGFDSASTVVTDDFAAGDVLSIVALRVAGVGTLSMFLQGCSLTIEREEE